MVWINEVKISTVKPRFNDLQYNDIPSITINICLPSKSYSKMYEAEPQYKDLRYNNIPSLTMGIMLTELKKKTGYNDKNNITDCRKCNYWHFKGIEEYYRCLYL